MDRILCRRGVVRLVASSHSQFAASSKCSWRNADRRCAFSTAPFFESLASTYPVQLCEKFLLHVHEFCGTPWWGTIIISVITLRTVITVPFAVAQRRLIANSVKYKPELDQIARMLAGEVKMAQRMKQWSDEQARNKFNSEIKRHTRDFYIKYNCHPAKAFLLPWFQIPLWICLSFALRNLCGGWSFTSTEITPEDSFRQGGVAWFTDLTRRDQTWIIPLLYGLVNIMLGEMYAAQMENRTRLVRLLINMSRFTPIILVPIAAAVPSAISFYWLTSAVFGVGQFLLLMSPRLLRLLRIPPLVARPTPYRTMMANMLRQRTSTSP